MQSIVTTHKNGIVSSEVISINPENIIRYSNNTAGYCSLLYDVDPAGKDKPINYVLTITKAQFDALIPPLNEIKILAANVLNLQNGVSTATTFNLKYINSLKDIKVVSNGVSGVSAIEVLYTEGAFISKKLYFSGTISQLTYTSPTYLVPQKLQYIALLTQTSTNAPVRTNVLDTITGVVIARTGAGTYTFTKAGAFTANKTFPGAKLEVYNDDAGNKFTAQWTSVNVITLKTYATADTSVLADGVLTAQPFNIEIYS